MKLHRSSSIATTTLFALATFASASLIFLVQPMVGKRILPWYGGGPGVWTLCLMFYQTALFLGYAYAHGLVRWASPRVQLWIHGSVFGLAALLLPVLPSDGWRPGGLDDPETSVLKVLFANVAVPFLALAATGPLVQAWFARLQPDRSPYPLYAVSNAGSLLALCAFPFWIEPRMGLAETSTLWSVGFGVCAVAVLACGFLARTPAAAPDPTGSRGASSAKAGRAASSPALVIALWLLLPAAAVVTLMAITNRLCLDLASVPFLWVIPLALYLVSFIVCFGSERFYRRTPWLLLALLPFVFEAISPMLGDPSERWLDIANSIQMEIALNCLLLLAVCMLMHGELYRLRPPPRNLTSFYLCVSGGGAFGGILVGIVAPRLFSGYFEFPIGLASAGLLMLAACGLDPRSILRFSAPRWRWAVAAPVALAAAFSLMRAGIGEPENLLHQERNFFGILRVLEQNAEEPRAWRHIIWHGNTMHGIQYQAPRMRQVATSYYGPTTGIGIALNSRPAAIPSHVGVVGLGAGTLALYGRPIDRFRFYELDPGVIRVALNRSLFSFLSDSAAKIELIPGDARLSLQAEADAGERQDFDWLVLDAFSSDAIPVHLLTLEAFTLFKEHLREDGAIAVHISNQHLELDRLVARLGQQIGLHTFRVRNADIGQIEQAATWMLLSRDPEKLRDLREYGEQYRVSRRLPAGAIRFETFEQEAIDRAPLWTDNYSDLFSALIWQDSSTSDRGSDAR